MKREGNKKAIKGGWLYHRCKEEGLMDAYQKLFGLYSPIETDAAKFSFDKYKRKYIEDILESEGIHQLAFCTGLAS